jgi:hypothetical protein
MSESLKKLGTPGELNIQMLDELHKISTLEGYTKKDVIVVPELFIAGQDYVLDWLKNERFKKRFNNVTQYYFIISLFALCGGIYYADVWHRDFSKINSCADYLYENGVDKTGYKVLGIEGEEETEAFDKFTSILFDKWQDIFEPYWELKDARTHTLYSFLAFFQLGVSIQMERNGFK